MWLAGPARAPPATSLAAIVIFRPPPHMPFGLMVLGSGPTFVEPHLVSLLNLFSKDKMEKILEMDVD